MEVLSDCLGIFRIICDFFEISRDSNAFFDIFADCMGFGIFYV